MTHTPGPWTTLTGDRDLDGARYHTPSNVLVMAEGDCEFHPVADCSCNHSCRTEDEQEANARLCAAAPDMAATLRACEVVLRNRDQDEREAKLLLAIRAVLAKAGADDAPIVSQGA